MDLIGKSGEDIAVKYFENLGAKILFRNYWEPGGELDIVIQEKDKTLVFVEVKSMEANSMGLIPEDNMTFSKLKKFRRIAEMFIAKHSKLVNEKKGFRLDLISVYFEEDDPKIFHYRNVDAAF